jgi:hypothetical protein
VQSASACATRDQWVVLKWRICLCEAGLRAVPDGPASADSAAPAAVRESCTGMSDIWICLSSCRNAPAVTAQPRVTMLDWRIVRVGHEMHLVGFLENGITCRVTTPIEHLDVSSRQALTASGRIYELMGPPASDPTQLAVMAIRTRQLSLCVDDDLTAETWSAMQAAMS